MGMAVTQRLGGLVAARVLHGDPRAIARIVLSVSLHGRLYA